MSPGSSFLQRAQEMVKAIFQARAGRPAAIPSGWQVESKDPNVTNADQIIAAALSGNYFSPETLDYLREAVPTARITFRPTTLEQWEKGGGSDPSWAELHSPNDVTARAEVLRDRPRAEVSIGALPEYRKGVAAHEIDHLLSEALFRLLEPQQQHQGVQAQTRLDKALSDPAFRKRATEAHPDMVSDEPASDFTENLSARLSEYLAMLRERRAGPQYRDIPSGTEADPGLANDLMNLLDAMLSSARGNRNAK